MSGATERRDDQWRIQPGDPQPSWFSRMRPASDRRVPLPVANVKCNHGLGEFCRGYVAWQRSARIDERGLEAAHGLGSAAPAILLRGQRRIYSATASPRLYPRLPASCSNAAASFEPTNSKAKLADWSEFWHRRCWTCRAAAGYLCRQDRGRSCRGSVLPLEGGVRPLERNGINPCLVR